VSALGNLLGVNPTIQVIGVRHGEKLAETLATREELTRSESSEDYFRIPLDARALDYDLYYEKGEVDERHVRDYDSDSTTQLSTTELEDLILTIPEFRDDLSRSASRRGDGVA